MNRLDSNTVIAFAETADEREAVYRQRYAVYIDELHLCESVADHNRKILTDAYDATGRLLYARIGDDIVGSMRVHLGSDGAFPEPFEVQYDLQRFAATVSYAQMSVITRLMITKAYRHSPVSFGLMHAVAEFGLRLPTLQLCFLSCAPHLINLYLRLGFRTYTRSSSDPEFGFFVPMVLVVRDLNYLARIASPFLSLIAQYVTPAEIPPWVDTIFPDSSSVWSERADAEKYWSQAYGLLTEKSQGEYSVFDGLTEDQIKLFLAKGHVLDSGQGELVIRKGTVANGLFVVLSGVVEVRDSDRVLAVLGRGEIFGEVSFLLASSRSASVYAASDHVRILSLDDKTLRLLIETDATTSAKFLLNLARVLCVRLTAVQSSSPVQS